MRLAVLGGGVSGISMAYWLLRGGEGDIEVHVFEQEEEAGGLCRTVALDGFRFDFGPHNIHSIYPEFNDFAGALLGDEYRARSYQPMVAFGNRFIPYPMKGLDILTGVAPWTSAACAASFLWSRIESLVKPWRDESFEDFIVNRFGRRLYDIYFGPFTLKTWGVPGSRISADFGRERIGVFTLWDLFKRTFLGIRPRASEAEEDPFLNARCIYPDRGCGVIMDAILGLCSELPGFHLHPGHPVERLGISGGRIGSVHAGPVSIEGVDHCFSTLPLPDISAMAGLPDPGLEYTSTRFVFLSLDMPHLFPGTPWVYFADERTRFNRVCEMSNMSRDMAPEGKTALCVEFTSTGSDAMWALAPEDLLDLSLGGLSRYVGLDGNAVEGWRVFDRRNTYPLRLSGYRDSLASAREALAGVCNLTSHGRLGGFAYLNMDHCFLESRRIAEEFLARRRPGED